MITMEQKQALVEALHNVVELDGEELDWCFDPTQTLDTIEDFKQAAAGYALASGFSEGEIAGLKWACWDRVQVFKGAPRRGLLVIDLGDHRVALDATSDNFN